MTSPRPVDAPARRTSIAQWTTTALSVCLGAAFAWFISWGIYRDIYVEPIGGMRAGFGQGLLALMLAPLWLLAAIVAVALNYRSFVAWLALAVPLLVTAACGVVEELNKAPEPVVVHIMLLEADKNPDGRSPAIQVRVDDQVERYAIEPGKDVTIDPGLASKRGRFPFKGVLEAPVDSGTFSGRIVLQLPRDFFLLIHSNLPAWRVTRGGHEVEGISSPLPPGEYVVEFSGEVP